MAKIKYEFLHQYYKNNKVPLRSKLTGHIAFFNKIGSYMPTLFNFLNRSFIFKIASDFLLKIDRRRNIPRLAPMTFNKMFKQSSADKMLEKPFQLKDIMQLLEIKED